MATVADNLTPREEQVIELVAQGLSNKEIAILIHPRISEHTVKKHVRSILKKFAVASRAGATAAWLRGGGQELGSQVAERGGR